MTPLSPSLIKIFRIRAAIASAAILVPALIAEKAMFDNGYRSGMFIAAALALAAFLILFSPGRRYRAWGYDVTEDELHIQSGIWVRGRTVVPFGRVQHIDVGQGPVERRYGVGTLTLHTAGTRGAAVSLPGLEMPDAERLRDDIRGKIRQDLV